MIKVSWYCGCYVGEPKWQGDVYEAEECGTEFETEVEDFEWDEGYVSAECPSCGAELTQEFDCPERIDA